MTRTRITWTAIATCLAVLGPMTAEAKETLLLGASNPGHSAYNIVAAYSRVINRAVPEVQASVQQSGGSIEAVQLIQTGRVHAAPAGAAAPYEAFHGSGKWDGRPAKNIRTWLPMYSWAAQLVVPEESPIRSWSDLAGKRVGIGGIGTVGEVTNRQILDSIGLGDGKIEAYRVPHGEMVEGLKNGMLDAGIETTGIPTPGILELMAGRDIRIVPNSAEEIATVSGKSPLMSGGVIPANTYEGIAEDVPVVVGYTIMCINESVPDDLVYAMTKAIWENLEEIQASHASQKLLKPAMIKPALTPIAPIHAGAERYYRERGWLQ